jgi:hypothetical protein
MEAAPKQEIIGFWPFPDMAQAMRVEHDRLAQLGWLYDGSGGYHKASSHPGPKLAASKVGSSTLIRAASEIPQRRGCQAGFQKPKVKRKA